MLTEEDRIHLIHDDRTILLNRGFDDPLPQNQEARPRNRSRTPGARSIHTCVATG